MTDRNVQFPNRYRLVKIPGTDDVFDVIPAPGEVFEEGDFLNKNSLLKDTTADLYGLGADALPDEVLAWIGKYNTHWWRRRTEDHKKRPATVSASSDLELTVHVTTNQNDPTTTVYYSDGASVTSTGKIVLDEPVSSFQVTYKSIPTQPNKSTYFQVGSLSGKVFRGNLSTLTTYNKAYGSYYRRGVVISKSSYSNCIVEDYISGYGEWEYLHDTDRNAYPDGGVANGFEYEYLGIPLKNSVEAVKINHGLYVGTGEYGEDSPNMLTFPFAPKLLIFLRSEGFVFSGTYKSSSSSSTTTSPLVCLCTVLGTEYQEDTKQSIIPMGGYYSGASRYTVVKLSPDRKTIYWYFPVHSGAESYAAAFQLNSMGYTYRYIAIG